MDSQSKIESQFYKAYDTWDSLREAAERVSRQGVHVTGALYSATESASAIFAWLKKRKDGPHKRFLVKGGEFSCITYQQSRALGAGETNPSVLVWMEPKRHLVYMLSCQNRELFEQIRLTMYRYLQPELCKVFLRTGEVQRALNRLAEVQSQLRLRVKEYTARSLIDDPNSQKRVRTNREWTDEQHETIFQKLSDERQWLAGLRLEVQGQGTAVGRVWRDATFSCESGFTLFFNSVVAAIAAGVAESRQFFDRRDRTSSPGGFSRPVKITYSEDVFADKRQNHRLLNTLRRLTDSSLSIYHPNPYFHASLMDYADGSSYELWVIDPASILVVNGEVAPISVGGAMATPS